MTLVRTMIGLIAAFAIGAVSVHAIVGNTGASITLYQGFNEIVWTEPEADLAATLSPVAGDFTAVFRWDNARQRWDAFSPRLPSALQGFTTFEPGRAYWIAMDAPATLAIGEPPADDPPPDGGAVPTFGDGTYRVGTEILPGRYRTTTLGDLCAWSRLTGFSGEFDDLIAIQLPDGASALVDIAPTDAGFQTSGCGTWTTDLTAVTTSPTAPFEDGTYLVGTDIAPGTWRAPGGELCSWERLAGFSAEFADIVAIELPDGPTIVTVADTDVGFRTSSCGVWEPI